MAIIKLSSAGHPSTQHSHSITPNSPLSTVEFPPNTRTHLLTASDIPTIVQQVTTALSGTDHPSPAPTSSTTSQMTGTEEGNLAPSSSTALTLADTPSLVDAVVDVELSSPFELSVPNELPK